VVRGEARARVAGQRSAACAICLRIGGVCGVECSGTEPVARDLSPSPRLSGAHDASALDLAARDKYQFQWWAVSLVDAQPYGGRRKGADGGIDGVIWLQLAATGKADRALVSVKAGANVNVAMIRDLKGTMEREKAPFGLFLTVTPPTRPMREEAASAGTWRDPLTDQAFSRLQIITLQELMDGKRPRLPIVNRAAAFRRAGREDTTRQERLL